MDRDSIVPLYIQVCNAFISLITDGTLKPSDILPSTRNLALLVGINRNTVKLAYEELISQGWTESIERKGVYVLSTLPSISKKSISNEPIKKLNQEAFKWTNKFKDVKLGQNFQKTKLAIDDGFPDVRLAPIDELMREYRSISRKFYGRNYLKYGSPQGSENLREALSNYLSTTRGLNASINDLLITKGSQMGIYLSAQLLLDPGDTIAVGMSNYPTADQIFKQAGANLLRIPIDHNGMDVDYLENKLKNKK
ncbi:PLP-dependent aminotransferase family protein [Myroides odoratimimus]|nr:PLP-dependent aminotransferase family protein [Myroides odoratimimus]